MKEVRLMDNQIMLQVVRSVVINVRVTSLPPVLTGRGEFVLSLICFMCFVVRT